MLEAHIAIVFLAFFRGVSGTFRIFVFGEYLIIFDPCNERWLLVKAVDFHAKIFVSLSFVRFSRSRS